MKHSGTVSLYHHTSGSEQVSHIKHVPHSVGCLDFREKITHYTARAVPITAEVNLEYFLWEKA